MNIKRREEIAAKVAEHLSELFRSESEHYLGDDIEQTDPNDLFTAFLLAEFYVFRTLTGSEREDLIDYTHLLNKLAAGHTIAKLREADRKEEENDKGDE